MPLWHCRIVGAGQGSQMGMQIVVAQANWGETSPLRIQALLTGVASHLLELLRTPLMGTVIVAPTACPVDDPVTLYRSSPAEPYQVLLSARGDYWCQFAYQFSHELCHILSGYENLRGNPNRWFHEAICEIASVFTIRRMAERWLTCPPFPAGAGYSGSLARYAEALLSQKERRMPTGMSLCSWLLAEEGSLRQDPYIRDKNAVVAYSLLPIFESEPQGWNTILSLPDSSALIDDYVCEWRLQVDPADQPFLDRIGQRLRR